MKHYRALRSTSARGNSVVRLHILFQHERRGLSDLKGIDWKILNEVRFNRRVTKGNLTKRTRMKPTLIFMYKEGEELMELDADEVLHVRSVVADP